MTFFGRQLKPPPEVQRRMSGRKHTARWWYIRPIYGRRRMSRSLFSTKTTLQLTATTSSSTSFRWWRPNAATWSTTSSWILRQIACRELRWRHCFGEETMTSAANCRDRKSSTVKRGDYHLQHQQTDELGSWQCSLTDLSLEVTCPCRRQSGEMKRFSIWYRRCRHFESGHTGCYGDETRLTMPYWSVAHGPEQRPFHHVTRKSSSKDSAR